MPRVSDNNCIHLLQETIAVLSQIQAHLSKNRGENSQEIADINQAMKSLQNALRNNRQKAINLRNQGYKQKFEEEKARKLEQLRQIDEQKGS